MLHGYDTRCCRHADYHAFCRHDDAHITTPRRLPRNIITIENSCLPMMPFSPCHAMRTYADTVPLYCRRR